MKALPRGSCAYAMPCLRTDRLHNAGETRWDHGSRSDAQRGDDRSGVYLIVVGLAGLVALAVPLPVTAVLALIAGVLILIGR